MTTPTPLHSPGRTATSREFIAVMFRRKWVILGLFAVTTVTVLAITFSTPIEYMSVGRVLIRRGEQESLLQPFRRVMNEWEQDLGSEVETVTSFPVLERAREILRSEAAAGSAPYKLVEGQVDAEVTGKTNAIAIAYVDRDPKVARAVCDAVVRAYIEHRQLLGLNYPTEFFQREIASVQKDYDAKLEQRRQFANSAGVVDVGQQKTSLLQTQGYMTTKRSEVAADLAEARAQVRVMRSMRDNPNIDLPTLGAPYTNESALVELKRRVVEQQARVAQISERYRPESPEVQNAKETLETLQGLMRREVDARMEIAQSRIEVLESRVTAMDTDLDKVAAQLATLPNKETTISELDQQISVLKSRYEELVRKSDQARITEQTTPNVNIQLLNPAGPARPRNAPDPVRIALAPAFALIVGIGLAFFLDGLDITVRTAGQAEEVAELPVLASLSERRRSG
jgi:polysaccharide biosynthesis transport protein